LLQTFGRRLSRNESCWKSGDKYVDQYPKGIGVLKFSKIHCLRYFLFLLFFTHFFILYTFILDTHTTSITVEIFVVYSCVTIFHGLMEENIGEKEKSHKLTFVAYVTDIN